MFLANDWTNKLENLAQSTILRQLLQHLVFIFTFLFLEKKGTLYSLVFTETSGTMCGILIVAMFGISSAGVFRAHNWAKKPSNLQRLCNRLHFVSYLVLRVQFFFLKK